jgi:hypothetical protein
MRTGILFHIKIVLLLVVFSKVTEPCVKQQTVVLGLRDPVADRERHQFQLPVNFSNIHSESVKMLLCHQSAQAPAVMFLLRVTEDVTQTHVDCITALEFF